MSDEKDKSMINRRELIEARLYEYNKALRAILTGQSYKMGDVELTRANLKTVQSEIARLENALIATTQRATRSRLRYVVPMDGVNKKCQRKLKSTD